MNQLRLQLWCEWIWYLMCGCDTQKNVNPKWMLNPDWDYHHRLVCLISSLNHYQHQNFCNQEKRLTFAPQTTSAKTDLGVVTAVSQPLVLSGARALTCIDLGGDEMIYQSIFSKIIIVIPLSGAAAANMFIWASVLWWQWSMKVRTFTDCLYEFKHIKVNPSQTNI